MNHLPIILLDIVLGMCIANTARVVYRMWRTRNASRNTTPNASR